MTGDGGAMDSFRLPEAPPDSNASPRVEAIEFSFPARIILIGYGLKPPTPPYISIGLGDELVMAEEDRFIMVGGPTAVAALARSTRESVLAAVGKWDKSSNCQTEAIFARVSNVNDDLRKFFAHWSQNDAHDAAAWARAARFPICAPGRAGISSLVTFVTTSQDGRHLIIAADDGILRLCYRSSGKELCRLKQSADGVWRAVNSDDRFEKAEGAGNATCQIPDDELADAGSGELADPWVKVTIGTLVPAEPSCGSYFIPPLPPRCNVWNAIRASSFVIL
jgi:hypothetical protein